MCLRIVSTLVYDNWLNDWACEESDKKKMKANSCNMMLVWINVLVQVSAFKPPFPSILCQLPANEPSDQRPDLRRGHPGRGQRDLLPIVGPPAAEVPPPNNDIIRALEPHLQMIKHPVLVTCWGKYPQKYNNRCMCAFHCTQTVSCPHCTDLGIYLLFEDDRCGFQFHINNTAINRHVFLKIVIKISISREKL